MFGAILTHRGIDIPLGTAAAHVNGEGVWEAFCVQVRSGFGLEFDIQLMRDGCFAVSHDRHLGRISGGKLNISLADISRNELHALTLADGRICDLDELLGLLVEHGKTVSALHLKHYCQSDEILDLLVAQLRPVLDKLSGRLIIFDVVPSAARYIKAALPKAELAASVAHPFDANRYGSATGKTLLSIEEVTAQRELYSWVWLDEWDRIGPLGGYKSFVNATTVGCLREFGFKVAAVSPELHATSPALLGGEAHEDAADSKRLVARWREWANLGIDALCTDHATWLRSNVNP